MYDKIKIGGRGEICLKNDFFKKFENEARLIHLVMIGTKPDIIKQAPLILELKKRDFPLIIGHTGQHNNYEMSQSCQEEFGIEPDFNLNVSGDLFAKYGEIIERLGFMLNKFQQMSKRVLPYVHGDTVTASSSAKAAFLARYAVGHVEAGLRTLTPPKEFFLKIMNKLEVMDYYHELQTVKWARGSIEPYPEQFDTRTIAPAAGLHFAPAELNRNNLLDEGFADERIFVTGNTISDAVKFAENRANKSTIFEKYPVLEGGDFIRFCIHRRENVSVLNRFKAIMESICNLVKEGKNVLLLSHFATERAIENFGFKDKIKNMADKYTNFVFIPTIPYTDSIALLKKCRVIATDSGGVQEEGNILHVPVVTVRFNSDRPETIIEGSNILAPPINERMLTQIFKECMENDRLNKEMRRRKSLYGADVSKKIIDAVESISDENAFRLEHERLGLAKMDFWQKGEFLY